MPFFSSAPRFKGELWDLIVLVSDHCLSFYFPMSLGQLKPNLLWVMEKKAYRSEFSDHITYSCGAFMDRRIENLSEQLRTPGHQAHK